jgi:RNA polymerase sigma factor (sigma-70 family)
MPDARDADDTRLLEEGNLAALLAKYQPVVLGRCIARLRGDEAAEDVAQNVMLRLVTEFQRGKRYSVPFRVVVHQVTSWTLSEYFEGKPTDLPLPEGWDPAGPDFTEEVEQRDFLRSLFGSVGEKTRQVLELRYLLGLEIDEIAARLGIKRNAVDQALNRGHKKLREVLASE